MDYETMTLYYDYCEACYYEGNEPRSFCGWYYEGE